MNGNRHTLKQCLAHAASRLSVKYGEFRAPRGVDDFLLDEPFEDDYPADTAARALVSLCRGDKSPMDFVVCIAVVRFLDKILGAPREDSDDQRIKDLARIVVDTGSHQEYIRWVASWYP